MGHFSSNEGEKHFYFQNSDLVGFSFIIGMTFKGLFHRYVIDQPMTGSVRARVSRRKENSSICIFATEPDRSRVNEDLMFICTEGIRGQAAAILHVSH